MTTQKMAVERYISAQNKSLVQALAELWAYRELFFFFAWRDVVIKYKQTVIGIAWALIRPIVVMVIFSVIFGKLAKLPSDGIPYPLLTFAALLPWQFFSHAVAESSNSVVANAAMIRKIYFPRVVVPVAKILAGSVDFLISLSVLAGLMLWYKVSPTLNVVFLPFFFLLAFTSALGIGLWMSALNVKYRDVRHIVPFIVQVGMYASPVGFSSSVVPAKWQLLYSLNPMVCVIEGFRWGLLGRGATLFLPGLVTGSLVALLLATTGALYFRSVESNFADVI